MKVYRLKPKSENRGLTKSSLVKDPAIESHLIHFNSEAVLKFVDEEKKEIYAPLLIPEKKVFRRDVYGDPAYVYFTADDIKELHLKGAKNGYDSGVSLNHDDMNVEGVYCFETWIIENPENDKSKELGFNLPKGTLMKAYKVDNEDVWGSVKNKDLMGLSIEVFVEDLEYIETNNNDNKVNMKKDKKTVLGYIKSLFNTETAEEYVSGIFGENLEEGAIITDADGNPLPDTEFEFENKIYKTDSMGAIVSIEDKVEEVEMEEDSDTELESLKAKVAELETENADLKAEIAKSKETVDKMQKQIIEAKKIAPMVIEKPFEQMTALEKHRYNKSLYS